jgi:hypothetical protein
VRHNLVELEVMKKLFKLLIPLSLMATAMAGCVVVPVGYYHPGYYHPGYYDRGYYRPGYYHRGYYGPRVAVVTPAPVVVVR